MKNAKKDNLFIFLILILFYIFFALLDGPIMGVDSSEYIELSETREPLYPVFLAFFRLIINKNFYLNVAVFVQCVLWACSTYVFVKYIKEEFEPKSFINYVIVLVFLMVSLLCRFVSKRKAIYCNTLLSESIAYPLFLLFITYLLKYSIHGKTKDIILTSIISFLLISTRKQMYFTIILIVLSMLYVVFKRKDKLKSFISIVIVFISIICSVKFFDYAYMYFGHNKIGTHTSDNRFITTMIIYTSNDNDANLIDDIETKVLFEKIYTICKNNGYLKDDSIEGIYNRVNHFSKNYDNIQIDTLMPIMRDYAKQKDSTNYNSLTDKYNSIIIDSLLMEKLPEIIFTLVDSFFIGLMITISADKPIFIIYSIITYLLYAVLLFINISNKNIKYTIVGLVVLLSIVFNVGVVSLVIFNQTRYTFYNMALFYISLLLMLYNVFVKKRKNSNL